MFNIFYRIITSKIIFFVIATSVIIGLNLTPLILQIRHAPAGRTFAMIHNNAQDFFFYQSLMNEGANGAWLISDPYTSEPHQQSIIFAYFAWLGKISKLLGLPYAITYHIVRISVSIFFLSLVFSLLSLVKVPYPRMTYLFFLFAAPFMHKTLEYGNSVTVPFMNWWTAMDPIRRAAYLPHHMTGGLLLVISIILIIKFFSLSVIPTEVEGSTKKHNVGRFLDKLGMTRVKYIALLILISIILAFVHTPSLMIILLIIPSSAVVYLLINKYPTNNQQLITNNFIIGLLGYWVIGLLFIIFMLLQTKNGFPWSQYIDWEKNLQFPLDRELIGAFGILFPFAILGIIKALRSKKFTEILIVCWFVVPLLFIPLAPKLNISNIRLIQGTPYLPLVILATFGIDSIISLFNKRFIPKAPNSKHQISNKSQIQSTKYKKKLFKTLNFGHLDLSGIWNLEFGILGIIFILFIIFTYPTLKWSLEDQVREYWPIFGNVYLDNRLNNAFAYINQNYPPKSVVLSTFYTGNYLPAFTSTVSFIGHFGYTYNIEEKEKNVRKFFENKMNTQEAKDFITGNKIDLIWQGPEEKPIYKDYLYPAILKPVYDKEEVTIYSTK